MARYKLLIFSLLCTIFFLQSCVHGTLDDCPPMVQYAVAFQYTNHTGTTDRFYSDVKKINLYVFDENGLIYTTTTKVSPYETNFNIPLDIPMGKYHIIAWGNALEGGDYVIDPDTFQIGQTSFDEARLYLNNYINGVSDKDLEKLFYGELNVDIPLYVSRVDTMPLTNNTNNVRLVIHYDLETDRLDGEPAADVTKVQASISANNSSYDFSNMAMSPNITYNPYWYAYNDSVIGSDKNTWLTMYYYSDTSHFAKNTSSSVYDFKILKMTVNSPIMLSVIRSRGVGMAADPIASVDIIAMFQDYFRNKGIQPAYFQTQFDKNEYYRIDMYVSYSELVREYVSGTIHVLPWHKVDSGQVPMN